MKPLPTYFLNAGLIATIFIAPHTFGADATSPGKVELIESRVIWDHAPHCAFTDLARVGDRFYCVFREGQGHGGCEGVIRVLTSKDGTGWQSSALLRYAGADLRDPKLSVTPNGRIMLNCAKVNEQGSPVRIRSMVYFSDDGARWDDGREIGDPEIWIWRPTWRGDTAYAVGYDTNKNRNHRFLRLYRSKDGAYWETFVDRLFDENSPGENTLRFRDDGTALCFVRRDAYGGTPRIPATKATALLGTVRPPYTDWTWKDTQVRVGGPNLIPTPDGRYLVAGRDYSGPKTRLWWLDPETARLTPCLTLPSGGDTSYAGFVWHEGVLWLSYYASHEGKSKVYLARVRVE